jgi:hypothetical protein
MRTKPASLLLCGYPLCLCIFVPLDGTFVPIFDLAPREFPFSGPHSFKTGHSSF